MLAGAGLCLQVGGSGGGDIGVGQVLDDPRTASWLRVFISSIQQGFRDVFRLCPARPPRSAGVFDLGGASTTRRDLKEESWPGQLRSRGWFGGGLGVVNLAVMLTTIARKTTIGAMLKYSVPYRKELGRKTKNAERRKWRGGPDHRNGYIWSGRFVLCSVGPWYPRLFTLFFSHCDSAGRRVDGAKPGSDGETSSAVRRIASRW